MTPRIVNGGRIGDNPRMSNHRESLIEYGSAAVSDGLRNLGKPFQAMDGGIRPIDDASALVGPAYTVRCYPGATWALEQSLEAASPGDVLVVDGGARPDVILMGGLMSTRAQARGLAGAVLDAAVRDIDHIRSIGFPVFSRYVCPRGGTYAEIGEQQTIVCCGRIPVRPGDWIVGDISGVAVIPAELLDEAVAEAKAIHERETALAVQLEAGKNFAEALEAIKAPASTGV